jgi:hypothetical protein
MISSLYGVYVEKKLSTHWNVWLETWSKELSQPIIVCENPECIEDDFLSFKITHDGNRICILCIVALPEKYLSSEDKENSWNKTLYGIISLVTFLQKSPIPEIRVMVWIEHDPLYDVLAPAQRILFYEQLNLLLKHLTSSSCKLMLWIDRKFKNPQLFQSILLSSLFHMPQEHLPVQCTLIFND